MPPERVRIGLISRRDEPLEELEASVIVGFPSGGSERVELAGHLGLVGFAPLRRPREPMRTSSVLHGPGAEKVDIVVDEEGHDLTAGSASSTDWSWKNVEAARKTLADAERYFGPQARDFDLVTQVFEPEKDAKQ